MGKKVKTGHQYLTSGGGGEAGDLFKFMLKQKHTRRYADVCGRPL